MKQKTKWKDITALELAEGMVGLELGHVFVESSADFRWFNVYDQLIIPKPSCSMNLPTGKIIGDA